MLRQKIRLRSKGQKNSTEGGLTLRVSPSFAFRIYSYKIGSDINLWEPLNVKTTHFS